MGGRVREEGAIRQIGTHEVALDSEIDSRPNVVPEPQRDFMKFFMDVSNRSVSIYSFVLLPNRHAVRVAYPSAMFRQIVFLSFDVIARPKERSAKCLEARSTISSGDRSVVVEYFNIVSSWSRNGNAGTYLFRRRGKESLTASSAKMPPSWISRSRVSPDSS